jgi:hypothetical protein
MHANRLFALLAFAFLAFASCPALANGGSGCIAHHPNYIDNVFEVIYDSGCSGHDEPELFPVSSAPGSARDLTWTIVLPTDGATQVSAVGPTFWFGGVVTDPKSLFGQAFLELQFYPDSIVTSCTQSGGFEVKYSPNTYSVCSPVWRLIQTGQKGVFHETAAFNAMLTDGTGPGTPLVMFAGDTVTIHFYVTPANDGFHITVDDLTTGGSGTIILNSSNSGPLNPFFDTQQVGNSIGWGLVNDAPNSFVWEIGHLSPYLKSSFCLPGQAGCDSYDASSWAGFSPIQIQGVTFGDGSAARTYGVVSDFGGKAEVNQYCGAANYGQPFCIYPWFTLGTTGYDYGVDYSVTRKDFGMADQFQQTLRCGGAFGANSTYCSTILK